nr:hypothetical protein [Tanacetum cinerariifolium]
MTKTKVINIFQKEAEKIEIDPKKVISAKAGEKFKKGQDGEMKVHKRKQTKKVKRLIELNKKRAEQYMWTMLDRLKPEPIINVKIYPNSKPEKKKDTIIKDLMTSLGKRLGLKLRKLIAEHRDQEKLKSNK